MKPSPWLIRVQEIRQSRRLGPRVADWVAQNEGRLVNHPQLRPRKNAAVPEQSIMQERAPKSGGPEPDKSKAARSGGDVGAKSGAAVSSIVPGGGLAAHEAAGGHLLLKHVGQSEQALMTRLANEPKISGSSSFYDRATAESAVSKVLNTNQVKIADWLNSSSNRLRLDSSLSNPAGISVPRGATGAVDVGSARVILVRDPSMPTGYKILTGFPTKP